MTDQTTAQPAAQTQAAAQAAPEKPSVNIDAVVKEVGEKLSKTLEKKNEEFAQELSKRIVGEKEKPAPNPFHEALATKPKEFFQELVRTTKAEAKKEVLDELKQEENNKKIWNETMTPIYEEIPELRKHDFELMGRMAQLSEDPANAKLSFKELAEKAADKAASHLNLKRLSEEERKRVAHATFAPPASGGMPQGAPAYDPDSRDSKMKYITQVRDRLNANRKFTPKGT